MTLKQIALVTATAGALAACGAEAEQAGATDTPLPAQTPIGAEDVGDVADPAVAGDSGEVVDPGEVPDTDRDGVPNASDPSLYRP